MSQYRYDIRINAAEGAVDLQCWMCGETPIKRYAHNLDVGPGLEGEILIDVNGIYEDAVRHWHDKHTQVAQSETLPLGNDV